MLKLVPKSEPTARQAVTERVKKMYKREDGMLQCNRCGCRTSLTAVNGAFVRNGRKQGGTVIEKDVCAECYKRGITSPMLPELKPVK